MSMSLTNVQERHEASEFATEQYVRAQEALQASS